MREFLKIANRTLAEQSRITRKLEKVQRKKVRDSAFWHVSRNNLPLESNTSHQSIVQKGQSLQSFRCGKLRREARAHNLAMGFFRGHDYAKVENSTHTLPPINRVCEVISVFSEEQDPRHLLQKLEEWVQGAREALRAQGYEEGGIDRALYGERHSEVVMDLLS